MASATSRRAEFCRRTRTLVAQRAGYRCSFPSCDRLTIGPGNGPCEVSEVGIAAHIYAAAASGRGPRGTRALSENELRSVDNAIWLCAHHAALIDKNLGRDYPAEKLHSFKSRHESRIARELAGFPTPFGWVDRVEVKSSPLFANGIDIELTKLNLVIGGNSVGKTGLCEWVAGHVDASHLERWRRAYPEDGRRLRTEMHYCDPDPHCIAVDFLREDYPRCTLDGEATVSAAGAVKAVFPSQLSFSTEEPDDLALVARALGVPPLDAKALCDDLGEGDDGFRKVWFEEHEEGWHLHLEVATTPHRTTTRVLRTLSSSEQARLLMQLGMKAANKMSVIAPTVLILDSGFSPLEPDWLKRYAEILASPNCRFQTIASTRHEDIDFDDVAWSGWKLIRLKGDPPNVFAD